MADMVTITVRTFRMGSDRDAAMKVLEEASEAREAWQCRESVLALAARGMEPMACAADDASDALADELADCITACCNLAARHGLDLPAAVRRVEARNRERGRYDRR